MKTLNTLTKLLLASPVVFLQGCGILGGIADWNLNWGGYTYQPQPNYVSQSFPDLSKIYNSPESANETAFKMRDGITQAPLFSKKGQVNITSDFVHGFGLTVSAAITPKLYIQAGAKSLTSNMTENKSANVPGMTILYYQVGSDTINFNSKPISYDLKSSLKNNTFFATIGKYHSFKKSGRFEYCAGIAYGSAENQNIYDFKSYPDYSISESRKYFQYFLQSDFGYVMKGSEGAIILKTSCYNYISREADNDNTFNDQNVSNCQFVLQPALKFAFGGSFRMFAQCGWNIPLQSNHQQYYSTNVQAGVIIRINNK
jgi:hypothetical protein